MKFREFETSSGKKVLAGKNAENNEELVAQVEDSEDVFHTAAPGSPFANIKAQKTNEKDRREVAVFTAAKSQDWRDNKSDVEVHWFKGKNISKKKGMKTGCFNVKSFKVIKIKKEEIENFIRSKR